MKLEKMVPAISRVLVDATNEHWKTRKCCAFLCFFLMLVQVRALNKCHPQMPGLSGCRRDSSRQIPLATRGWNSVRNPSSLRKELKLGEADDASLRPRVSAQSDSENFNMLPHRVSIVERRVSRRTAAELTPSRQAIGALTTFKASISGGNVSIFDNWEARDATPCGWTGVTCSAGTEQVTGISLVGHELEGSINSALLALGQLPSLRKLDLSNNNFGSFISGASLVNVSSLAYLNLSYNQLDGRIPHQIGELTNLQLLAFQFNNLSGQIPPSICNCTLLRDLNLQENLLEGQIPQDIGRVSSLETFVLGNYADLETGLFTRFGNSFSGGIPPSLGNCTSLKVFDLGLSGVGGPIPDSLSGLKHLEILTCSYCQLSGVIPEWIANLTDLTEIHLAYNVFHGAVVPAGIGRLRALSWLGINNDEDLTGTLPASIGNCTALTIIRIGITSMTGVIPASLSNCSLLREMNLAENPLLAPGPIPSWLGSLTQLEVIVLEGTNRYGEIPSGLGRLSNLTTLGFWSNALVGPIPSWLSNCTSLVHLALDENRLTGSVPFGIGSLTNLYDLELNDNFLTGSFPKFITNLTLLAYFYLADNYFRGTLDFQWGVLQNLEVLSLEENLFTGNIPGTLGNCSNLEIVGMGNNVLVGEIPTVLGNLSYLSYLDVSWNSITGYIPDSLARCSGLTSLDMSSNRLHGPFPVALGNFPVLTQLNISHNALTGSIFSSIRNLSQILWLDFSFNLFTEQIPRASLSSLQQLVSLNASHNFLAGYLSAEWNTLQNIQEIDVSANIISGIIPKLDELRALHRLDLSLNNFSGNIPESLASLPNLVFFNASYNNLEGHIPDFQNSKLNLTAASFLGNPVLCGVLLGPLQECPQNVSISTGECKNFQCTRIWIPVLVAGVACVLLISAWVAWAVRRSKSKEDEFDIIVNFRSNFLKFLPADIMAITKDESNLIGTSAGSLVYKGLLPGCHDLIAIKTFVGKDDTNINLREANPWHEWLEREADLQSRLQHRNVLRLLSFCAHAHFRALLFEYMPKGSLHDHLYHQTILLGNQQLQVSEGATTRANGQSSLDRTCELSWSVRLGIAMDIVDGMTYLHHECPEPLIHGDLKPSNILLDEEMVAKVSDFGISKLVNPDRAGGDLGDGEATVSRMCGTVGYMPPEYALVAVVTTKGDVYSYGVLLLEMLCGISPTRADAFGETGYRDQHLRHFQESPLELLDPKLQGEGKMDALKEKQMMLVAKVALFATRKNFHSRPSMKDIRSMLLQIKGLEVEVAPQRTLIELAQESDDEGSLADALENANPD